MISDFFNVKEKYNLILRERTTLFDVKTETWTFPDALNAKGWVIEYIEYKQDFRFAGNCFYDAVDDCIKFIGIVSVEPSNYDFKIKSLREMFDSEKIKMKQYRLKNKMEKIEEDFE